MFDRKKDIMGISKINSNLKNRFFLINKMVYWTLERTRIRLTGSNKHTLRQQIIIFIIFKL